MPILGIIASSFRSAAGPTGAYDSLATVTLSATASSITFSGIPSGYKHLQIRALTRTNRADLVDYIFVNFNGDSGSNYTRHFINGDGSTAASAASTSATTAQLIYAPGASQTSGVFGAAILDILDYANTNKYKTMRTLLGLDGNGNGQITLNSNLWMSTSAINSITFIPIPGNSFVQYTQFALYGVK